jgi:Sec1-binding region of Mso1
MASYLSYFTSNRDGQPSYGQHAPSSGGSSQWTSTISSRIGALRKALTKDSEDDDPDHEDCSHVSNVLRAYYTEKGRPFPDWLPPDPKKPAVQVAQPVQYGQVNQYTGYGASQYGSQRPHSRGGSGGRGGLSDLWDPSPAQTTQQPQPQSLRTVRPTPQSLRSNDSTGSGRGMGPAPSQPVQAPRLLPSQRSGSYQTSQSAAVAASLSSRDRLRQRVQAGGGSGRNSPAAQSSMGNAMSQNSYSQSGSHSSSGSSPSPYVSASEPWASGQDDYYGGYNAPQNSSRQQSGGPR